MNAFDFCNLIGPGIWQTLNLESQTHNSYLRRGTCVKASILCINDKLKLEAMRGDKTRNSALSITDPWRDITPVK